LPGMEPPVIAPAPRPKSLRWGTTLNLILPGAGLFYLGRRKLGAVLAFAFLICLVAALGIFLLGYVRYLNVVMSNGLLQDGQLEQLADVFHKRWLIALVLVGLAIQAISILALTRIRRATGPQAGDATMQ